MRLARARASETNPNDQVGGGGCVCSDTKREGCRGPYAIFEATSTDAGRSPHVVISRQCLQDALLAVEGELMRPTTDKFFVGGTLMTHENLNTGRLPGYGPRDQEYIPVDGEDAKELRDGSPGANELASRAEIARRDQGTEAQAVVAADAPPAAVVGPAQPVSAGVEADVTATKPGPIKKIETKIKDVLDI